MTKIIVIGKRGRMSSRIATLINEADDIELTASVGKNETLESVITKGDVIIDFTLPEPTVQYARIAAAHQKPIVIGTTGLNEKQYQTITDASKKTAIVFSPNMSLGVNVLFAATKLAATALGKNFRATIEEVHHVHKLDKPSGTAKKLAEVAACARGESWNKIPITSHRTGEVVGDHVITFENDSEVVTISHHAKTRDIFALGAIAAARWIVKKPPGLYTMMDVLGL